MTTPMTRVLTFSVLVEEKEGAFVGHCLETGLVAVAEEENEVLNAMGKLLERQILFALKHDRLGDIYHSAPHEVWSKWNNMQERIIGQSRRPISEKDGNRNMPPRFLIDQTAYAAAC